ncbi:MAG: hypothetical protein HQ463_03460 [Bacteroidetes bacterium]|nr:hypothetical protein [Bacteroidota bacterium]
MVEVNSTDFTVLVDIKDIISLNYYSIDVLGQLRNRKTKDIQPETVNENQDN